MEWGGYGEWMIWKWQSYAASDKGEKLRDTFIAGRKVERTNKHSIYINSI